MDMYVRSRLNVSDIVVLSILNIPSIVLFNSSNLSKFSCIAASLSLMDEDIMSLYFNHLFL